MVMRTIVFIFFFFFSFFSVNQLKSQLVTAPEELFSEGQYFFQRGDYKEALYFFKQLVAQFPGQANYNFKAGECYLNISGMEEFAVPYLEVAVKQTVPKKNYKAKDFAEGNAPLHAYFYLGNAYRAAGRLDDALTVYNAFLASPYFYGNYNQNVVEQEMKSCERAKIIQDSPIELVNTPLDTNINTSYNEYNPVISRDGRTLAFVRGLKFYEAVFVSRLTESGWSKPVNISEEIVSDGDYYPTGLGSDGKTMLLVRTLNENADIYISKFINGKWSKAEKLPGKVNTIQTESFASFGYSDSTIYLVSNRSGTRGGLDIFVSEFKDGVWGKPKNLGKTINTEYDEDTPSLCIDGKTLFFSSKGHYNMGGFDIFYSYKENKKWADPRNAGFPVNTTRDDRFFYVFDDCMTGLFSILDRETGVADIYQIEIKSKPALPW